MKTISNILLFLLAAAAPVTAQSGARPEIGFVRIVNAVSPGTGNADFLIDGSSIFSDGYALGQTTGGYAVKAGTLAIGVRKTGVEPGSTQLRLGIGETVTVIAFAERLPEKKEDEPPRWVIRLLRLKQQGLERGYGVSMISVCRAEDTPVDLVIEGSERPTRIFAKRMKITTTEIRGGRAEMMVRSGDRLLTHISPDTPGNYVVILYENADGELQALSYFDARYVIAG
jgi:hypothetical protein